MSAFGGIADIARQGDWLIGSRVSVQPENFQGPEDGGADKHPLDVSRRCK